MKLKAYQIIAGGIFCLGLLVAVIYAIYIFSQNVNYNSGNTIILDFVIVGMLFWISSIILFRRGKSQNGSQFLRTIIISLLPTAVCLAVYFFIFTILAFKNLSF